MNKLNLIPIVLAFGGPAFLAPLTSQDIVVSPVDGEMAAFVKSTSQELDQHLERVVLPWERDPRGIVRIRFQVDPSGRASNVEFYSQSGNRTADRAALKAVKRLGMRRAMPVELVSGHVIQANIIFATSNSEFERYSRRLAKDEAVRLAASPAERTILALSLLPDTHS